MIGSITPENSIWLQTHILEPYMEGSERIERAWEGKEIPSFIDHSFSFKERIVLLVKGSLLMIPLINTIVWIVMQVLGEKRLSDGCCLSSNSSTTPSLSESPPSSPTVSVESMTENETPLQPPASVAATIDTIPHTTSVASDNPEEQALAETPNIIPISLEPTVNEETFWYEEKIDTHKFEGEWVVTNSENEITVKKTSTYNNSTAIYSKNKGLQSIDNKVPCEKKSFKAHIRNDGKLEATALLNGKSKSEIFTVTDKGLWIQQPLFGFKNFALLPDKELKFFFIHPETLALVEMIAIKTGEEMVEGLGNLLKIKTNLNRFGGSVHTAFTWVDPKTGVTKKADCPALYIPYFMTIPHMTEILLPNHP